MTLNSIIQLKTHKKYLDCPVSLSLIHSLGLTCWQTDVHIQVRLTAWGKFVCGCVMCVCVSACVCKWVCVCVHINYNVQNLHIWCLYLLYFISLWRQKGFHWRLLLRELHVLVCVGLWYLYTLLLLVPTICQVLQEGSTSVCSRHCLMLWATTHTASDC